MNYEAGFLKDICDHPQDDTPRLVYADWLDERGEPGDVDRAELIRAQIVLARNQELGGSPLAPERRRRLESRVRELLEEHGAEWEWPVRMLGLGWAEGRSSRILWSRGFPEGGTITADSFLANGPELFARAPVRSLAIRDLPPEDVPLLASSPALRHLASLDLSGTDITDASVRMLAGSSHLTQLTSLDLSFNEIGDGSIQALANSSHLRHLTNLRITHTFGGDEFVHILANSPNMSNLTMLDLSYNNLTNVGVQAFVESPFITQLKRLYLGYNRIGTNSADHAGLRGFATSPNMKHLAVLDLTGNEITEETVRALIASPNLRQLTNFNINGNPIGAHAYNELRRVLAHRAEQITNGGFPYE